MMRKVEEEASGRAAAKPLYIKLLFVVPDAVDHRRFSIPFQNEVCAVVTLNADQSFPDNESVIRQRGKSVVTMKIIDSRVEPFTYPLFYPKGTLGFTINLPLRSPYAGRQHLTRLELAQFRVAFRPQLTKEFYSEMNSSIADLRLSRVQRLTLWRQAFPTVSG